MPTPKYHGGAPIFPVPLVTPGFFGLNKQEASSILGPEWATSLINAQVDDTGRIGARKGVIGITDSAIAAPIRQTFEFYKADRVTEQISSTDDGIYKGTATLTDISGALTITDGNWQFQNYTDRVVGFQDGENPIIYTGSGDFAEIVPIRSGTMPQGGVGLSAYGRLWAATDDYTAIRYCDILDETVWDDNTGAKGDAGTIDMKHMWPAGTDRITAIVAHNAQLVVFGEHSIVIFADSDPTNQGTNPDTAQTVDTISTVGCIARDSVREVRGDLWFLSEFGVQSLGRLIQEKSAPLSSVSKQIQDYLIGYIEDTQTSGSLDSINAVYSPKDRIYWLSFPDSSTSFAFDTRGLTDRGEARVAEWTIAPEATSYTREDRIVLAQASFGNVLGRYSGYLDNGATYPFVYESGWLNLGEEVSSYLKILKRLRSVINAASTGTITFKWWWDFSVTPLAYTVSLPSNSAADEWGNMEWNDGAPPGDDDEWEWSGGLALRTINVPGRGTGQYIKVGMNAEVSGSSLGLQQLDIISKIGRYA
jgi:hypothetical protein